MSRVKSDYSEKFRNRLLALREEMGLSMADVAACVEKDLSTIGHWEKGRRHPGINDIVYLSQFFGVTVDYLVGASDERE